MTDGNDSRQSVWKFLRRIVGLFHGRLPTWAVLLIVLFGGGGIFYAVYDFINKQHPASGHSQNVPQALPLTIEAAFFPAYITTLPAGVLAEVSASARTVTNLKLVFDFQNSRLQSCEVRTPAKLASPPAKTDGSMYVANVVQLLPEERFQVYCLVENPQTIRVIANSTDSDGGSVGFSEQTITRTEEKRGSGFYDFLEILAGFILVGVGACIIYIVVGLTGRLAAWLKLFR